MADHNEPAAGRPASDANLSEVDSQRRRVMGKRQQTVNMFDPVVFCIRIGGKLSTSWFDCFDVQSISVEVDEAGLSSTTLISKPVDQAALIGMINHLNNLGLPLVSVECLPAPVEDEP